MPLIVHFLGDNVLQIYDKLRRHDDIRFEIKKVQKTSDKIFLLVQVNQ